MLYTRRLLAQQLQLSEEDIAKAHDDPSPEEFCLMEDPFYMSSSCYLPYAKALLRNPVIITFLVIVLLLIVFGIRKIMIYRMRKK